MLNITINMYYIKSPLKSSIKEEEIKPWNAEQSNMLNLIIESTETNPKFYKSVTSHMPQEQKVSPNVSKKQSHSFNFCSNLRKYQKKRAQEFTSKRDVNFIEKNIKGVSQDYLFFNENSSNSYAHKTIQQKHRKGKLLEHQFNSTIEPINWSLIMYYQENKGERKHRHKDIQSFLRFQSQKMQKNSLRKESLDSKAENIEQNNKYQGNKYQKLLKLRQGLRNRNLKSASESRKIIDNSLNIEQTDKNSKQNIEKMNKTLVRILPKTSQSSRNPDAAMKIQITPNESPRKQISFDPRIVYTSHRNRINSSRKKSMDTSRLRHK